MLPGIAKVRMLFVHTFLHLNGQHNQLLHHKPTDVECNYNVSSCMQIRHLEKINNIIVLKKFRLWHRETENEKKKLTCTVVNLRSNGRTILFIRTVFAIIFSITNPSLGNAVFIITLKFIWSTFLYSCNQNA